MDEIGSFLGRLAPYEFGRRSFIKYFWVEGTFSVSTQAGFKVPYLLKASFRKVSHRAYRAAKMLEKSSKQELLAVFNDKVVLPALSDRGRRVRFIYHPKQDRVGVYICRDFDRDGSRWVGADANYLEIDEDIRVAPFRHFGCEVDAAHLSFMNPIPRGVIDENYRLLPLFLADSYRNKEPDAKLEEIMCVDLLRARAQVEEVFAHSLAEQSIAGRGFQIKTRQAGKGLEIAWEITAGMSGPESLVGYRREGGFGKAFGESSDLGAMVVEARRSGKSVMNLSPGVEYFFTFVFNSIQQPDEKPAPDFVRFSARIPTEKEILRLDTLLANSAKGDESASDAKITAAVEELRSFVKFEDAMGEFEAKLISEIRSKGYTREVADDKIERLKAVVEEIRLKS